MIFYWFKQTWFYIKIHKVLKGNVSLTVSASPSDISSCRHTSELPSLCIGVQCESLCEAASVAWFSSSSFSISYPFIMREGSSVSTQAAELTKRFSGGRAVLFPATVLETTIITLVHDNILYNTTTTAGCFPTSGTILLFLKGHFNWLPSFQPLSPPHTV